MKTYSQLINEISKSNDDDMDDSVNDEKLKDNVKKATVKTKHPVATDDQFDGGVSKDKSRKADVKESEEWDEILVEADTNKLGVALMKKYGAGSKVVKDKAGFFHITYKKGNNTASVSTFHTLDAVLKHLEEGKLPPHLAKFVNKKGDFTDDVKKRLGKDGEERLLGKKEKKTVKEAALDEISKEKSYQYIKKSMDDIDSGKKTEKRTSGIKLAGKKIGNDGVKVAATKPKPTTMKQYFSKKS